ncbi:MAG: peptide-methionine (S)-S-oxide reductase MsrA [bacterium]|nr:peptide-methionine (S)-S-oxide reductase MsrA [bacterium]MDZ4296551.1 peptide-methionine (S)-S-oxide reductase MsrA [Patescibacteria group bacterium]
MEHDNDKTQEVAVFGGGCFWCTEAVFAMLGGVISVTPGYAGGTTPHPSYAEVSSGATGHAEVSRILYDPQRISFRQLLTVFFATHDPTTPNRQGNDVGTQYRSIVLYTSEAQRREAERFIAELDASSDVGASVVTELKPSEKFHEAEDEHRDYYARNRSAPYCQVVINPKLEKVQKQFAELLNSRA